MAIPVSVVLDRTPYGTGPLDLTSLVDGNSLNWSSVMPGGFASCSFQLDGDFRKLLKQVPYLSILRVIGDSGRVLFEGEVQDLAPHLDENSVSMRVTAIGLQTALSQVSLRSIWSKRDLDWKPRPATLPPDQAFAVTTGNFDPTDLTKSGVMIAGGNGTTTFISRTARTGYMYMTPVGVTIQRLMFTYDKAGNANLQAAVYSAPDGATFLNRMLDATNVTGSTQNLVLAATDNTVLLEAAVTADFGTAITDLIKFYDIRILGTTVTEDTTDGFYGGSLIRNILSMLATYDNRVSPGVIEAGSEFTIDHLDASTRRTCIDLIDEVAQYYSKEWAVWEDGRLDWRTPQLSEPQWIIPISQMAALDLDASTVNSFLHAIVLYTDAGSGRSAETVAAATDRRNPFVLTGKISQRIVNPGFPMTSNTAPQLASRLLQDLGFGPVPAAGTISVPGEVIVQHAQGNAVKAWEIRAGDNVTIPELPLTDVFTQDGRGETTFHVISAEASGSSGLVTLSLDSYGSKRSDVLLARLAAVTAALGG